MERATEDRLPQPRGALQVGKDGGLEFFGAAEAALDFGDDAVLLGKWRQRDLEGPQL